MTVPSFRLLLLPLLKTRVTVPSVVGSHWRSTGWSPVAERPASGILKAFCARARRGALRSVIAKEREDILLDVYKRVCKGNSGN